MIKRFGKALKLNKIDALQTLGPFGTKRLGCAFDILETIDSFF